MPYPIKLSLKSEFLPIILIIASFVLGGYFYANFPDQVATHWNFQGQVDGYSGKFNGAFLLPIMLLGIYLLLLAVPLLDPRSQRYGEFAKVYHIFKAGIVSALFLTFLASGLYNLGYHLDIRLIVPLAVGTLMILIGNFMGKIKSNWFVGIRTPWTLSSENVWNKTHRLGGWMFVLFGAVIILSPFLPKALGVALFVIGAALATLGTIGYSYRLYRKEKHQNSGMV